LNAELTKTHSFRHLAILPTGSTEILQKSTKHQHTGISVK